MLKCSFSPFCGSLAGLDAEIVLCRDAMFTLKEREREDQRVTHFRQIKTASLTRYISSATSDKSPMLRLFILLKQTDLQLIINILKLSQE
jgi:hypothetical protein